MKDIQKRFLLFLLGCVTTRLGLVYAAKNINKEYLPYMGAIGLLLTVTWLVLFFGGLRKTGGEVFGGIIWWDHLRPIHAMIYGVFAVMAFMQHEYAWVPLLIDVLFGLIAFLHNHWVEGNFSNL